MGLWNTGSVAEAIWGYVDTMPTYTSGALPDIAERQLIAIQQFNGTTVNADSIDEKYQPYVLYATLAEVYCAKADAGTDQEQVKLGDFSVKKGSASSASDLCAKYSGKAEVALYRIGINTGFRQVFG